MLYKGEIPRPRLPSNKGMCIADKKAELFFCLHTCPLPSSRNKLLQNPSGYVENLEIKDQLKLPTQLGLQTSLQNLDLEGQNSNSTQCLHVSILTNWKSIYGFLKARFQNTGGETGRTQASLQAQYHAFVPLTIKTQLLSSRPASQMIENSIFLKR